MTARHLWRELRPACEKQKSKRPSFAKPIDVSWWQASPVRLDAPSLLASPRLKAWSFSPGLRAGDLLVSFQPASRFAATVCGGLGQQLKFGDQLSTTNQCIGRLRSLHVLITTGTGDWVTEEYAEIAQTFPEFVD